MIYTATGGRERGRGREERRTEGRKEGGREERGRKEGEEGEVGSEGKGREE